MGDATQLSRLVLALAAAVVNAVAPYPAFAQHVAVIVNGAPITTYDIDQRTKEVRDKMLAQEFQTQAKRYLEQLRHRAMIEVKSSAPCQPHPP
ncbi:MAG TPA: hypothetical protein VKX28_25660 [Xanthobacteraceae bacterium]|nr:hypothetical protein [Xanthobacteraceae bacterium]